MASTTTSSADESGRLDVSLLKTIAKNSLIQILNSVNGAKTLILDPSLSNALSLVAQVSLLKDHGVSKIFWLEPPPLNAPTKSLFYLLRPTIPNIRLVASHIKSNPTTSKENTYKLVFVPRSSTLTDTILENEGVRGSVDVVGWDMGFIPLEPDLVSLERDTAFRELWVDEDPTPLHTSLAPLSTLHTLFGPIPRIIGKGIQAHRLSKMLVNHLQQSPPSTSSGSVDALIIIDRKVDMLTPLLTQLTYEGLMDEVLSIKNSHVELPQSLFTPTNTQTPATSAPAAVTTTTTDKEKPKKHLLSSETDPLLPTLRDLNFSTVGKALSRVAHRLDQDYQSRHNAQTVAQLKDFVGRLGGLQSEHQALKLHTGLTELITPYTRTQTFNTSLEIQQNFVASYNPNAQLAQIDSLISSGAPLNTVLRLMCLASLTSGGIKVKVLEGLKREILQSYGYNHLPTLLALSSPPLSLLLPIPHPPNTPPVFPHAQLRKSLRLLIEADEVPTQGDEPSDISYVYSGWAPMSVRLVQCIAQKEGVFSNFNQSQRKREGSISGETVGMTAQPISGWKGFEEVVEMVPGDTFDITLPTTPSPANGNGTGAKQQTPSTTIIYFLGGITYTEIAALRWMARQNRGRRYLIATTGVVSGDSIMDCIGVKK